MSEEQDPTRFGTPGCAAGSRPDRTNIYMTPEQLAKVRALKIASGGERIFMDLAQVQELLAALENWKDTSAAAIQATHQRDEWQARAEKAEKDLALFDPAAVAAYGDSRERQGQTQGWREAFEKVSSLAAEFGDKPESALSIIGEYAGEALHGTRKFEPAPIDMVLHCPKCHLQHVDAPEPGTDWTNPPHRSHKCKRPDCGTVWRPADVPTNGVAVVKTLGKADTWARSGAPHPYPPGGCPLCKDSNLVAWHSEPIPEGGVP